MNNRENRLCALENYYKNPKICKQCGCVIEVKENQKCSEVRKKIFCGSSCSSIFNNKIRTRKIKPKTPKIQTQKKEKFDYLNGVTKKEFFEIKGVYYKFRAIIRRHAHYVYNKNGGEQQCKICGYDKHVEVCHIKSVSSFEENDLIVEINSFENLVGLCPNHHWEFDNGHITLT